MCAKESLLGHAHYLLDVVDSSLLCIANRQTRSHRQGLWASSGLKPRCQDESCVQRTDGHAPRAWRRERTGTRPQKKGGAASAVWANKVSRRGVTGCNRIPVRHYPDLPKHRHALPEAINPESFKARPQCAWRPLADGNEPRPPWHHSSAESNFPAGV